MILQVPISPQSTGCWMHSSCSSGNKDKDVGASHAQQGPSAHLLEVSQPHPRHYRLIYTVCEQCMHPPFHPGACRGKCRSCGKKTFYQSQKQAGFYSLIPFTASSLPHWVQEFLLRAKKPQDSQGSKLKHHWSPWIWPCRATTTLLLGHPSHGNVPVPGLCVQEGGQSPIVAA